MENAGFSSTEFGKVVYSALQHLSVIRPIHEHETQYNMEVEIGSRLMFIIPIYNLSLFESVHPADSWCMGFDTRKKDAVYIYVNMLVFLQETWNDVPTNRHSALDAMALNLIHEVRHLEQSMFFRHMDNDQHAREIDAFNFQLDVFKKSVHPDELSMLEKETIACDTLPDLNRFGHFAEVILYWKCHELMMDQYKHIPKQ